MEGETNVTKQDRARRLDVKNPDDAIEFCYDQGWTDGLPVVPPTPDRVNEMVAAAGLPPDHVIGRIPERRRSLTVEQAATNAVMAGCKPAYMPVVMAALEALLDPGFSAHGPSASMAGAAMLVIVNGPYAREIGINSGLNALGQGHRANATIGRSVRLVLQNVLGGVFERSTLGHPGKYSFCIGETESANWDPLHVLRGFDRTESVVTLFACEGPTQVGNHVARTPEGILLTIADKMRGLSSFFLKGNLEVAIVIGPEHFNTISGAGWSKQDVREFLTKHARRSLADIKRGGLALSPVGPEDEETYRSVVKDPQDLLVLVAGGEAGRFSAIMNGWGYTDTTRAVSKRILV